MLHFLTSIMDQYGYIAILFFILLENILPFIPSEIILPFAGFSTTLSGSSLNIWELIIFATIISTVGAIIIYFISRKIELEKIYKLLENKWIKRLGFKKKGVDRTISFFKRWQGAAVLIGRCLPVVRVLISIPAGIVRMNLVRFTIFSAIGSGIWNIILIMAGKIFGENWAIFLSYIERYNFIVFSVTVLFIIIFTIRHFLKKGKF